MKSSEIIITELNVKEGDRLVFEFEKSKDYFNVDYIEFKYRNTGVTDLVNHIA